MRCGIIIGRGSVEMTRELHPYQEDMCDNNISSCQWKAYINKDGPYSSMTSYTLFLRTLRKENMSTAMVLSDILYIIQWR